MSAVPWTFDERPDTRTTNVRLGLWLFLASEAMFFGSILSAYVLLKTGGATWPPGVEVLNVPRLAFALSLLVLATLSARRRPDVAAVAGALWLVITAFDVGRVIGLGQLPSTNVLVACWFVSIGLHWLHTAGAVGASLWLTGSRSRIPAPHVVERRHAVWLYWCFVDVVWVAILVSFYFI